MSIKFETINGKLCRMVEPEPLMPEATFPCVAQFNTSDHRTINLRNRKPFILRGINNEGYVHYELAYAAHYSLFEIIGYPVVEGSAEWALYQMMQGKKVRYKSAIGNVCWALNQDGDVQYYDMSNLSYIGTIRSKLEFVERKWDNAIWTLYEEPEFKVGDWVRTEDGDGEFMSYAKGHLYDNSVFFSVNYVTYDAFIRLTTGKYEVYPVSSLLKLPPSEVRVKVTLEGQVTKPMDNTGGRFWLYYSSDEYVSIELDALSRKDRELVESLLKAQEEK